MADIDPSPSKTPENAEGRPSKPTRGSWLGGFFEGARQMGRDVVSVAMGRLTEPPEAETTAAEPEPGSDPAAAKRVSMAHAVAEQLRGAADSYVAAKLDELEARVDEKLDHIEGRIDEKIVELHKQLAQMRDRELRHRLRLLKITLIFTVLVALLSLLYKWIEKFWQLA